MRAVQAYAHNYSSQAGFPAGPSPDAPSAQTGSPGEGCTVPAEDPAWQGLGAPGKTRGERGCGASRAKAPGDPVTPVVKNSPLQLLGLFQKGMRTPSAPLRPRTPKPGLPSRALRGVQGNLRLQAHTAGTWVRHRRVHASTPPGSSAVQEPPPTPGPPGIRRARLESHAALALPTDRRWGGEGGAGVKGHVSLPKAYGEHFLIPPRKSQKKKKVSSPSPLWLAVFLLLL